ncbi:uncharacterized protein LOC133792086 [Humulus lupulus]|uniref:uncharacterized protein LOC133792086 n=1 Tax=Humulus lupulus TaxID=3486 RepID=UPI002B40A28B|nr:uncharacterized protein LOC133792086 [Humulus lupulus]
MGYKQESVQNSSERNNTERQISQVQVETLRSDTNDRDQMETAELRSDATEGTSRGQEIQYLHDYRLVRDRVRREIKPPERFGYADLIAYALNVAEEEIEQEPLSYKESVNSKDSHEWIEAIREEMISLYWYETWELIDNTAKPRTIGYPGKEHCEALKWNLRYIKGSITKGLVFGGEKQISNYLNSVKGYVYSDYAGCLDTRKSITGYIFTVLGTTGLIQELGIRQTAMTVFCDTQSGIQLSRNHVHHDRKKHIHIKMHFIGKIIQGGTVLIDKISTNRQPFLLLRPYKFEVMSASLMSKRADTLIFA